MKKYFLLGIVAILVIVSPNFFCRQEVKSKMDVNTAVTMEVTNIIDCRSYCLFEIVFTNHTEHHVSFGSLSKYDKKSFFDRAPDNWITQLINLPSKSSRGLYIAFSSNGSRNFIVGKPEMVFRTIPPHTTVTCYLKLYHEFFRVRYFKEYIDEDYPISLYYGFLVFKIDNQREIVGPNHFFSKPIPKRFLGKIKTYG